MNYVFFLFCFSLDALCDALTRSTRECSICSESHKTVRIYVKHTPEVSSAIIIVHFKTNCTVEWPDENEKGWLSWTVLQEGMSSFYLRYFRPLSDEQKSLSRNFCQSLCYSEITLGILAFFQEFFQANFLMVTHMKQA